MVPAARLTAMTELRSQESREPDAQRTLAELNCLAMVYPFVPV